MYILPPRFASAHRGARRWACALIFAAAAIAGVAEGAEKQMAATLQVDGWRLHLVSCGVRDPLWLNIYVAGLYVPRGTTAQAVRDPQQTKAVELRVLDARDLPPRIPAKWHDALARELSREPMQRVRQAYRQLHDGDVATFTYAPGRGVTMQVNGRIVVRARGHGVIDAILSAWAGSDSIRSKLEHLPLDPSCRPARR